MRDCPTGSLSRSDFQRIYNQFFPFGDSTTFADYAFGVFDKNGNGVIEFEEFIVALSVTARGDAEEKIQWAFQLYDIDKDGFISKEEMLKIVDSIYRMVGSTANMPSDEDTPEKRVEKIFQLIAQNLPRDAFQASSYMQLVELKTLDVGDNVEMGLNGSDKKETLFAVANLSEMPQKLGI
ncbi:hypothetical protein HK098_001447 [Nowakowskiella sp. JEL0407]|nr:hypothetical protein HK098_001447 [Nowakowskiella sp. JEL0407]